MTSVLRGTTSPMTAPGSLYSNVDSDKLLTHSPCSSPDHPPPSPGPLPSTPNSQHAVKPITPFSAYVANLIGLSCRHAVFLRLAHSQHPELRVQVPEDNADFVHASIDSQAVESDVLAVDFPLDRSSLYHKCRVSATLPTSGWHLRLRPPNILSRMMQGTRRIEPSLLLQLVLCCLVLTILSSGVGLSRPSCEGSHQGRSWSYP